MVMTVATILSGLFSVARAGVNIAQGKKEADKVEGQANEEVARLQQAGAEGRAYNERKFDRSKQLALSDIGLNKAKMNAEYQDLKYEEGLASQQQRQVGLSTLSAGPQSTLSKELSHKDRLIRESRL